MGEYSALVAAEALDFATAVRLVKRRGELMDAAVPAGEGGMAAVLGLSAEQIAELCQQSHAISFYIRILNHDHDFIEELINRFF